MTLETGPLCMIVYGLENKPVLMFMRAAKTYLPNENLYGDVLISKADRDTPHMSVICGKSFMGQFLFASRLGKKRPILFIFVETIISLFLCRDL